MTDQSACTRYACEFNEHPNGSGKKHTRHLARTLMREESDELAEALGASYLYMRCGCDECQKKYRNLFSCVARELADVVYVAFTAAWAYDIDLDAALVEIHRAAMSKIEANVRRDDGKLIKHLGFIPPDMTEAVRAA